jgi:hypothetical protein
MGEVAALALVLGSVAALVGWVWSLPAPRSRAVPADPDADLDPAHDGATVAQVSELTTGAYVAVTGRVVGAARLVAPLTRRRCVAFELRIRVGRPAFAEEVAREAAAGAITLGDGTGVVTIDGARAAVHLPRRERFPHVGQTRRGRRLLGRLGLERNGPEYDAFEAVLLPGDRATVIGVVDAPPPASAEDPYRAAGVVPRLVSGTAPLMITTPRASVRPRRDG